ncbi:GntR family transcriptional regulator [Pseudoroseicyclus tamaricis]|uniref:GntR family transcriptional regulator n=1 Tax=Pseudoroseicyclus tamaricis TaxID=2705421 RepID=A0A6B2K1H1_9RHOB|nr:GntR family transcriptional regulator [Pseudoroseicyclus tamaricis]NDV02839.1 GntR family transcriptional regulator [Pseudoroseicyclus tamaricis]
MAPRAKDNQEGRALLTLRERILGGVLPGGTRLFEVPLAEEMRISRTPLRAAMSRLAEEGLLERARGGGFLVRAFTVADVIDAIELRGVLEGTAARLAAERGVPEARLAEMRALLETLEGCFGAGRAVAFERYAGLNGAFHDALQHLPGSEIIARELQRTKTLPFASPSAFLPDEAAHAAFEHSLFYAQAQHRALVEAISAREGARAEAIAREHARLARRNLDHLIRTKAPGAPISPALALVID